MWKQHARLSRLKKPDNGKRTSGACKETGQRRWKENGIAIKRTNEQRKLEQRTKNVQRNRGTGKLEDTGSFGRLGNTRSLGRLGNTRTFLARE
jgi:hypothetical protein